MRTVVVKKELNVERMKKGLYRSLPDEVEKRFSIRMTADESYWAYEGWFDEFRQNMAKKYPGKELRFHTSSYGAWSWENNYRVIIRCEVL